MSTIDTLSKSFLRDPEVVANLCNIHFFPDSPIVRPQDLVACPEESFIMLDRDGKKRRTLTRHRDVLKQCVLKSFAPDGKKKVFIGLEAQTKADWSMTLRVLIYDALSYLVQDAMGQDGRKGGPPGGSPPAKLVPVRTLVVFFGTGPWTAPTKMGDLLIQPNDWPGQSIDKNGIDVLSLSELDDRQLEGACDALKCVAKCLRYARDKQAMKKMLQEDELFSRVPNNVVDLVGVLLNVDIRKSRKKETTNMCQAIEELFADARAEGRAEGEAKGRAEGEAKGRAEGEAKGRADGRVEDICNIVFFFRQKRMSEKRIISSLVQIFSLKPEEARSFL